MDLVPLVLAANTASGNAFPSDSGYTTAAVMGAALMVLTLGLARTVGRRPALDGT